MTKCRALCRLNDTRPGSPARDKHNAVAGRQSGIDLDRVATDVGLPPSYGETATALLVSGREM